MDSTAKQIKKRIQFLGNNRHLQFFTVLFAIIALLVNYFRHPEYLKMTRLSANDPNSYSTPETVIVRHVDIAWEVDFTNNILKGNALLKCEIIAKEINEILLDVSDINVQSVFVKTEFEDISARFMISDLVKDQGSKLTIVLPTPASNNINLLINYETSNQASALQWLSPEQTLGKKHPYLYSQCQAIHARSILPCQDTPGVKFTYTAKIQHPEELTALMSAITTKTEPGVSYFDQTVPIPSYLIAIAVGKLVSRPLGPISAVWAEEGNVDAAAFEFSETSKMLQAAESICGPYVWKKYDLLLMPPSFPYGGMENPCLTFVTPTLLAGDKSLANVVAHEIAHSWTGNLVTNKNFEHFWLNEGFTVFVEGKIGGRLEGDLVRDFHSINNLGVLRECIFSELVKTPELTKLVVDLSNLNPDDAFSSIPYMKGSTFLNYIENLVGGPSIFEPFLQSYLNKYKYKSISTSDFKDSLLEYFSGNSRISDIDWDVWLYGEGMPPVIPEYNRSLIIVCEKHSVLWRDNTIEEIKISPILNETLSSTQVVEFLDELIEAKDIVKLNQDKIDLLSETYKIKKTQNAEIRFRFLRLAIRARLLSYMDDIIAFANSNFRMKFVRPIYRDLAEWPEAKPIAVENFEKVRNQMIKVCAYKVAKDLGLDE